MVAALTGAVLGLLLGPVVGVLWLWIAPTPVAINTEGAIYLKDQDTKAFIAADGWFLVIGFVVGGLVGALVYWRFHGGLAAMLGVTVGALGGAYIAWKVGVALGPPPLAGTVVGVPDGGTLSMPIGLRAKGVLLGWPLGGVVAFMSLTLGLEKEPKAEVDAARAEQEHHAALDAAYAQGDDPDPRWA